MVGKRQVVWLTN